MERFTQEQLTGNICTRGWLEPNYWQLGVEGRTIISTFGLLDPRKWGLREWFVLTYLMGAFFIGGQATEYAALVHEGITIQNSAYGTMFYLTGEPYRLAAAALNGFFGALTVVFIWHVGRRLFSPWVAAQAAWWACFFPSMIIFVAAPISGRP